MNARLVRSSSWVGPILLSVHERAEEEFSISAFPQRAAMTMILKFVVIVSLQNSFLPLDAFHLVSPHFAQSVRHEK